MQKYRKILEYLLSIRSTNNNNPSTNFTKGSLIELANGDLRPVEDMRTEDFILSSNKNPELQMADTTVVKIVHGTQNNVLITFSYNGNTVSKFYMIIANRIIVMCLSIRR